MLTGSSTFCVKLILRAFAVLLGGDGGNTTISYAGQSKEHYAVLRERGVWGDLTLDVIRLSPTEICSFEHNTGAISAAEHHV